jgi:hypothetical protein
LGVANLSFSIGTFSDWYSCPQIEADRMLVPEAPGIYAVMDRETSVLIYVGKAMGYFKDRPRGLRDRIFKEHLKPRARGSALRRYVASELGIPIYRDQANHQTVDGIHEENISRFLGDRALFTFAIFPWGSVPGAENAARRELKPRWNPL